MSVSYGRGDKAKATKLHSSIIRSLGYCENFQQCGYEECPCEDKWSHKLGCKLQCAHIQGRTASATRTQLRNAFCLCASCHRIFTDKPLTFSRFVTTTWAQQYRDELISLSNTMTKMDWTEEFIRLSELAIKIESNNITLDEARETEC